MSNNRLWLVDDATGDRFCLAKGGGSGWWLSGAMLDRELDDWLATMNPETGNVRDLPGALGKKTRLRLECEGD